MVLRGPSHVEHVLVLVRVSCGRPQALCAARALVCRCSRCVCVCVCVCVVASGAQLSGMAEEGMVPSILARKLKGYNTPYMAIALQFLVVRPCPASPLFPKPSTLFSFS